MIKNLIKKALVVGLVSMTMLNYSPKQVSANEKCSHFSLINGFFQGIVAGVGGYNHGKDFWKSFGKGFTGGVLNGVAKCMVGDNLDYAWPAKLTSSIGSSIVNDTTNGDDLGTSFSINYGPAFLEWRNDREKKFKGYLLPDSLIATLNFVNKGYTLNLEESIRYGVPFFYGQSHFLKKNGGINFNNNIGINPKKEKASTKRHELIHSLQYASSYPLGNLMLNSIKPLKKTNDFFEDYGLKFNHTVSWHTQFLWNKLNCDNVPIVEKEAYGLTK